MKLMPVPLSQLQVKGTCPSVPQQRGALSWHGEGMCSPCSCTAVSLSPAQFHMQLHCQLSLATALTDQSHSTRAISSPQLQPQTHSYSHTTAGHGAAHNGSSQAAPLGTGGEVGLRKAENGGGRDVESWERALGFCSQNTLVPLQHHP